MNKQTIEVLEETKTSLNKHFSQWGDTELTINPVLDDALSKAIQALKALECAEKVLGEKKVFTEGCFEPDINYQGNCTGFNEMHDIAKPIIARLELDVAYWREQYQKKDIELEGLEEDYKGSKEIWESVTKPHITQKDLIIKELGKRLAKAEGILKKVETNSGNIIKSLNELIFTKKELSQLKGKLSRENLGKITAKAMEDYSVDEYGVRGDDGDYSPNKHERFLILDYSIGLVDEIAEAIQKECGIERASENRN